MDVHDEIRRTLGLLFEPGDVVELRALNTGKGTVSGYFTDFDALAREAARLDGKVPAVYVTLNPVQADLLFRAINRCEAYSKHTTADHDILRRRWLFFDFDAVRVSGISATDAEYEAAIARAREFTDWLLSQGVPPASIILANSGNGAHVLVRVDLPNDVANRALVDRVLRAAALLFGDGAVNVDVGVGNAARIVKLYGTLVMKGDATPDRPHRRSRLLEWPEYVVVCPIDVLESLAAFAPDPTPPSGSGMANGKMDIDAWLAAHGLSVWRRGDWNGGTKWVLDVCPWNPDHRNHAAYVVQFANGAIAAGCHHNGCANRDWRALRDAVEPGWREWHRPSRDGNSHRRNGNSTSTEAVLVRLADVKPERVRWLWPGRVPLGKLTVLDGDPDRGKSLLTLDIAARVTKNSAMPDGTSSNLREPRGVVLLSAEDDLADTIRPRLDAAGADVNRIVSLESVKDARGKRGPTVADLDALEDAIRSTAAALTIVDPLMAHLPDGRDSHRDQDIRRALAPLADLASRTGAAVVVIRHFTKSGGGNPLYRGGGSIGIIGAARSGLLVAPDPDAPDDDRRILAVTKSNLAAKPPALAYHLEVTDNVARVVWEGPTEHTATALLAVQMPDDERTATDEAVRFLQGFLTGGDRPAMEAKDAARQAGIASRTLERARPQAGVTFRRRGFGRDAVYVWSLHARQDRHARHPQGLGGHGQHGEHDGDQGEVDAADGLARTARADPAGAVKHLRHLAGAWEWPQIYIGFGQTVPAGPGAWDQFVTQAPAEHIAWAIADLESLEAGRA